jgi:hypothetical protein
LAVALLLAAPRLGVKLGSLMKLLSRTWVRQAHVLCEALNALKVGPLLALH